MIDRLSRAGAGRPHVLVIAAVDATAERLAAEAEIGRRTWPTATSPADTDILVVAGEPGVELAEVIAMIWTRIPAPRARIAVPGSETVPASLAAAVEQIADRAYQRRNVPEGHTPTGEETAGTEQHPVGHLPAPHGADSAEPDERGARHGHGESDPEAGRHAPAGESDGPPHHGGHDHHGGGMELPGGLSMAGLGGDRDGLMLDRLHVPLGPVLPDWPHGLVLDAVLQGDVVQEARLRVLGSAHPSGASFWGAPGRREPRREVVRRLDGLARFLGVAGWPAAASTARELRDETLDGASPAGIQTRVGTLTVRVRRSRTLRRMLRGLRAGDDAVAELLSDNLSVLDASAAALARNRAAPSPTEAEQAESSADQVLRQLESRLVGAELAAARLIVAAVDPDLDMVTALRREPAHPDAHAHD